MNTKRSLALSVAAASVAAFLTTGCPRKTVTALTSDRTRIDSVPPPAIPPQSSPQGGAMSPAETIAAAPNVWLEIKDVTYDTRARFFSGLEKLEAKADAQIQELKAKRATMNSTVDTKNWDFAMKEMGEARLYLKATGDELKTATPETWNQLKDKVGLAWIRTQEAYSSVKASTTI